jgi:hypothetical protein
MGSSAASSAEIAVDETLVSKKEPEAALLLERSSRHIINFIGAFSLFQ